MTANSGSDTWIMRERKLTKFTPCFRYGQRGKCVIHPKCIRHDIILSAKMNTLHKNYCTTRDRSHTCIIKFIIMWEKVTKLEKSVATVLPGKSECWCRGGPTSEAGEKSRWWFGVGRPPLLLLLLRTGKLLLPLIYPSGDRKSDPSDVCACACVCVCPL